MSMNEIIKIGIENNASDVHIIKNQPPIYRIDGQLVRINNENLSSSEIKNLTIELIGKTNYDLIYEKKEIDFSFSMDEVCRCRTNIFLDRGNISMAIRIIPYRIPDYKSLGLPSIIEDIINLNSGLVLITGETGSGKTTTLSTIIDLINTNKSSHIITIEDPIEYLHENNKSIINQRQIGDDARDFLSAIRSAMRQDPDIISIGEMRDSDTISSAISAAETGHLVLSTIHTDSVINTISKLIDSFQPEVKNQIRTRLASVIKVIISQKLISRENHGRVIATEVMVSNTAIKNLIRENKIHQINNTLQTNSISNMRTMDQSLLDLYKRELIDKNTLIKVSVDRDYVNNFITR